MVLDGFIQWLAPTPLSGTIGSRAWVAPAVQTAHILATASSSA